MKKIKNFVNINYLWLLLGSYLVVVLVNLLRFSTEVLFLKLGAVGVTTTVIGLVVSYLILWFLLEYKKFLNTRRLYHPVSFNLVYSHSQKSNLFLIFGLANDISGLVLTLPFGKSKACDDLPLGAFVIIS